MSKLNGTLPVQAATDLPSPPVFVPLPGSAHPPAGAPQAQPASSPIAKTTAPQPTHVDLDAVKAAARQIESWLQSTGRSVEFQVNSVSGQTVVTVRSADTGEVIRQIPSEETLRLAEWLSNGKGALVNVAV